MFVWHVRDQTRTGHILGEAHQRSEAPERQMTYAQSCILRLLTHLSMLQGAIKNQRVRIYLSVALHICGFKGLHHVLILLFFGGGVCRKSVHWSTPHRMMSLNSCGIILKRTWRFWGRLWIRTWTTQRLQFTWSWHDSLQVILTQPWLLTCCL